MKSTLPEIINGLLDEGRFLEAISLMKVRGQGKGEWIVYETFVEEMKMALERICCEALPGVIVEEIVHEEMKQLKIAGLDKAAILKYVHSEPVLNEIMQCVLAVRIDYCLPLIHEEENDFFALREVLRKITVYRCRRQVIAGLCQRIVDAKKEGEFTQREEAILVLLREEYLQAVQRQTETMTYEEAISFLEAREKDPMLHPLPMAQDFMLRVKFPRKELKWLIKGAKHITQEIIKEREDLHSIDSPIEVDILGEITKALGGKREDFTHVYKRLYAHDFSPAPSLIASLLDARQHRFAERKIRSEKNTLVRQQWIEKLYLLVKESKSTPPRFWFQRRWAREGAIYLLQDLYVETLKEQAAFYNGLILENEALHSIVWQEVKRRRGKMHEWGVGNSLQPLQEF